MIAAIIDYNVIMRTGICTIMTTDFNYMNVLEFDSVTSILATYSLTPPDLIIVAHRCVNNIQGQVALLRNHFKLSAIAVYDIAADTNIIRDYINAGAIACVSQIANASDFASCIQSVTKGKRYISPDFQELVLSEVLRKNSKPNRALSIRENEVANYLSTGESITSIAKTLDRSMSTISTIKKNIYKKLEIDNIVDLNIYLTNNHSRIVINNASFMLHKSFKIEN
jgi:DNA-binding NarL/FixJ family response regulator